MINGSEIVAPMLVNFSIVGFVIFIGIAAFIPMAYDVLTRNETLSIARNYPIRLIARLSETRNIRFLIITSFFLLITGLLGLLFLFFEEDILLEIALMLAILIISFLLIFIIYISVDAISIKKAELDDIVEYSTNLD